MLEEQQHKTQEALRLLMQEDRHHKHLEEFLIQILEITTPKEGLFRTIIHIEGSIHNLLIDEVIVPLEIIPLIAQVERAVIGLHLEVVPHQDQGLRHQEVHLLLQEVHLLQEVVQNVLIDK